MDTQGPSITAAYQPLMADAARRTYRWVRLGLLVAPAVVLTSGAIEWWRAPGHCLQGSLSEYYWTPVRPTFVGGLMALSLGLIVLRGATSTEDTALNLAGLLAPIVAVVPVRPRALCSSAPQPLTTIDASVDNSIRALLIVASVCLVALAMSMTRPPARPKTAWIGLGLAVLVVAGFGLWCLINESSMEPAAHYVAAIGLFGCLVVVVAANARHSTSARLARLYWMLVAVMVLAVTLQAIHLVVPGFSWSLLGTESLLMGSFAVFWVSQTAELWDSGVRLQTRRNHSQ